jgi:hypothetical protein
MSSQDEIQLRERVLALAVAASPDRAAELAEGFLAFVKAGICDRSLPPEGTSQTDRAAG